MDKDDLSAQQLISREFDLPLQKENADFVNQLALKINELILRDFTGLINLLYRVDIDEKKLKILLSANAHEDAGNIIARLIIERQTEKAKSRNSKPGDNHIPEDERW